MNRAEFDAAREGHLLQIYLGAIDRRTADWQMGPLRRTCSEFGSIVRPGESILAHAHSTLWVRDWIAATRLQPSTRKTRMVSLLAWWSWLFDRGVLDDNVLACFTSVSDALETTAAPLVLTCNLQRPIAMYLKERGPGPALSSKHIRRSLRHFNVFLNRRASMGAALDIDEPLVIDWLRDLSRTLATRTVAFTAGSVTPFLQFLVETGRLRENPLAALWARHRRQDRVRVVGALVAGTATLQGPVPAPRFASSLAPRIEQFIALKRAMGRKYAKNEVQLRQLDRFVASRPGARPTTLSRELVEDWFMAGKHLHPRTKKKRVSIIRQLALHMARFDPSTYVPDRTSWPPRIPKFKAYIYAAEEYRGVLKAALDLPSPRSPLRPRSIYTLLLVLYTTGLRVGEATRLRLSDVDLTARTFQVRETKFFKSRLVPFSAELAEQLRRYLEMRNLFAPCAPDSPFFVNNRRRAFGTGTVANTFKRLLAVAAGSRTPTARRRHRLHDVRHTYACSRVLGWYREGADVAAKLPLLATYMGHVSVLSTEIYLNSTAAILQEASHRFEGAFGALVPPFAEVDHERR